jgi:hypothetical protein
MLDPDEPALSDRLFRPERAQLSAATDAVRGESDPRAAWETLAVRGLIPNDWVDTRDRRFRAPDAPAIDLSHPPTVAGAIAIASDVAGVLRAEALAREVAARFAPWFPWCDPHAAVWRLFRRVTDVSLHADDLLREIRTALARSSRVEPLQPQNGRRASALAPVGSVFERQRECARCWRWSADARQHVQTRGRGAYRTPASPAALRFDQLANPFPPLFDLWATGYALDRLEPAAVVLAGLEVLPIAMTAA